MQSLGCSITRTGHVRRIHALKRIISHLTCRFSGLVNWGSQILAHMPKAHGTQEPR
jgi:hypothetical protein